MAEINSRQAAKVAALKKLDNNEHGRRRTVIIQTPETFSALAINDTIAGGVFIPKGSRIVNALISNEAGTASSAINVGLRKRDGTVVDSAAIVAARSVASFTTNVVICGNGSFISEGASEVLSDDMEPYITALVAALAANQAITLQIEYVGA